MVWNNDDMRCMMRDNAQYIHLGFVSKTFQKTHSSSTIVATTGGASLKITILKCGQRMHSHFCGGTSSHFSMSTFRWLLADCYYIPEDQFYWHLNPTQLLLHWLCTNVQRRAIPPNPNRPIYRHHMQVLGSIPVISSKDHVAGDVKDLYLRL